MEGVRKKAAWQRENQRGKGKARSCRSQKIGLGPAFLALSLSGSHMKYLCLYVVALYGKGCHSKWSINSGPKHNNHIQIKCVKEEEIRSVDALSRPC